MVIRHNYFFLLAGMLLFLLGSAVDIQFQAHHRALLLDAALASAFVLGVWTLVHSRKAFIAGCVLGAAFVALDVAALTRPSIILSQLTLVCVLLFFFLTSFIAIYDVLFGGKVDINRIVGAVCIYLLSGSIWGIVYYFLHYYTPTAFAGLSGESWRALLNELTYHSFVTLTTLGYGDVTPVSPLARTLSYLEAILGQIYLTVLVAALVGVHIASHRPTPAPID